MKKKWLTIQIRNYVNFNYGIESSLKTPKGWVKSLLKEPSNPRKIARHGLILNERFSRASSIILETNIVVIINFFPIKTLWLFALRNNWKNSNPRNYAGEEYRETQVQQKTYSQISNDKARLKCLTQKFKTWFVLIMHYILKCLKGIYNL